MILTQVLVTWSHPDVNATLPERSLKLPIELDDVARTVVIEANRQDRVLRGCLEVTFDYTWPVRESEPSVV